MGLEDYNTPLESEEEVKFQTWLADQSKTRGKDLSRDLEDYDLRGYWASGAGQDSKTGHGPDTFKKPNHPTFSDESKYHGVKDAAGRKLQGGRWIGDDDMGWSFQPSPAMVSTPESRSQLRQYFADYEPDVMLLMPPAHVRPQAQSRFGPSGFDKYRVRYDTDEVPSGVARLVGQP